MERQRLYRASLGDRVDEKDGHAVFPWYGELTECGEWVEEGDRRWRRDDTWFPTEAAALASLADRIEAIGEACLRQAIQLRCKAADRVTA
jgi:hypothetical protein